MACVSRLQYDGVVACVTRRDGGVVTCVNQIDSGVKCDCVCELKIHTFCASGLLD